MLGCMPSGNASATLLRQDKFTQTLLALTDTNWEQAQLADLSKMWTKFVDGWMDDQCKSPHASLFRTMAQEQDPIYTTFAKGKFSGLTLEVVSHRTIADIRTWSRRRKVWRPLE